MCGRGVLLRDHARRRRNRLRRRGIAIGRRRTAARTTLPPAALRLRVTLTPFGSRPTLPLPLRRVPTTHQLQTLGLSAVALVPLAGQVSQPAPLTKANPPPQPPTPGGPALFAAMLQLSHGRRQLPGAARGGSAYPPRALSHCSILALRMPSGDDLPAAVLGPAQKPERRHRACRHACEVAPRRKPGRTRTR